MNDEQNKQFPSESEGMEQMPEQQTLTETQQPAPPAFNWKKEAWEWTMTLGIALVATLIIRTFLFTLVSVDGPSMENTMHTGDRLFVYRLMYQPKAGDIVVFTPERYPKKPYIKRIIATGGQTLSINSLTGDVMVDGVVLDEPYIKAKTIANGDVTFPVTVPEGYFFAMGDNRPQSHDCRSKDVGDSDNQSGMVSEKRLMGKALFRLWPLSQFGSLYE